MKWGKSKKDLSKDKDPHFPITAVLIENCLSTKIYSHDFPFGDHSIPCWTYVSQGLVSVGQTELVITVQRERGEKPQQFPEDPLHWFSQVYQWAQKDMVVSVGGRSGLRSGHFMTPGMIGVLYQKALPIDGIELPAEALCMVPVTSAEFEATEEFGQLRMLSLLGNRFHYYPFPPWFERERESVIDTEMIKVMQASMCAQMPRVIVRGLRVMQHGKTLHAIVTRDSTDGFNQLFGQMPPEANCLRFSLDLDERADACLFWQPPGSPYPQAITKLQVESGPSEHTEAWVAGTFVSVVSGSEKSAYRVFEDGFALMLTEKDWNAWKHALKNGEPLSVELEDDTSLKLSWEEGPVSFAP